MCLNFTQYDVLSLVLKICWSDISVVWMETFSGIFFYHTKSEWLMGHNNGSCEINYFIAMYIYIMSSELTQCQSLNIQEYCCKTSLLSYDAFLTICVSFFVIYIFIFMLLEVFSNHVVCCSRWFFSISFCSSIYFNPLPTYELLLI